jgi:hypothetical protein
VRNIFLADKTFSILLPASASHFSELCMMERRVYFHVVAHQDHLLVNDSYYNSCFETWQVLLNLLRNLGCDINYNKPSFSWYPDRFHGQKACYQAAVIVLWEKLGKAVGKVFSLLYRDAI